MKNMNTDGYWLFQNLFHKKIYQEQKKDKETEIRTDIATEFIQLIKKAPVYSIEDFENIVNLSWNKKINPVMSKVIMDIIIEKISKIEKKSRHNRVTSEEYDFVTDVSTLVPNPYKHSPLICNDNYKLKMLRESIKKIMNTMETASNDMQPFDDI